MIKNYRIGDRVKITKQSWLNIRDSNRSILCFPSDNFVNIAYTLMADQIPGTVTHRFEPGYEFNVTFDNGKILQLKDHWVENCH